MLSPCVRREALISPPAQESVDELIKGDEHLLQIAPHHFVEKSTGWKAMTIFPSSSFVFAFSIASLPFFLIGCLSGLNNFELQSLELVKTDLMPNVVGVHEDQTAPALRVHEGGRRFRRRD